MLLLTFFDCNFLQCLLHSDRQRVAAANKMCKCARGIVSDLCDTFPRRWRSSAAWARPQAGSAGEGGQARAKRLPRAAVLRTSLVNEPGPPQPPAGRVTYSMSRCHAWSLRRIGIFVLGKTGSRSRSRAFGRTRKRVR